jgi:hypothetical protein
MSESLAGCLACDRPRGVDDHLPRENCSEADCPFDHHKFVSEYEIAEKFVERVTMRFVTDAYAPHSTNDLRDAINAELAALRAKEGK